MTSSGMYESIYRAICEDRKPNKEKYAPGSGLHCHHIIPRHMGGLDEESNYTYLTVREHVIAHFLLYKIHRNVNDLRSMHMLGANLSVARRREIGKWCFENKIGWHAKSKEEQAETAKRQREERLASGNTNEWDYWASKEGRTKRSSMGGKASAQGPNHSFKSRTPEEKKRYGKMGGLASPTLPAYNPETNKTRKFYTQEGA